MPEYNEAVAEYFRRAPKAVGSALVGEAGAESQGVRLRFSADIRGGNLVNVGFRAFACPHIIAACSWLAECLEGTPLAAPREIDTDALGAKFDIPVEKAGKLLILKDAIAEFYADAGRSQVAVADSRE